MSKPLIVLRQYLDSELPTIVYADGEELSRQEMREIAEPWRPYRSVATRYIWAEYESE